MYTKGFINLSIKVQASHVIQAPREIRPNLMKLSTIYSIAN